MTKKELLKELKKKNKVTIKVYQHDWVPGFGAYRSGSLSKKAEAHVVLNLGGLLGLVVEKKIDKKDIPYHVAQTLMHEIVHALEEWAGKEFSEKKVAKLINSYYKKYGKKKFDDGISL